MENPKAILKYLRTFSEEQNEEMLQEELVYPKKFKEFNCRNAFDRDSLLYVIFSDGGGVTARQQSEQEKKPDHPQKESEAEKYKNDIQNSDVSGCFLPESSEGGAALKASLLPGCQHSFTECTKIHGDCLSRSAVEQDDAGKCKENVKTAAKTSGDVHDGDVKEGSITSLDLDVEDQPGPSAEEAQPLLEEVEEQPGEATSDSDDEEDEGETEEAEEEDQSLPFRVRPTEPPAGSPTEKQIQLPALFSGLRVLRKGVKGPGHDTISWIKPSSQRDIVPEKQDEIRTQGNFLDQISQFLNREKKGNAKGEKEDEDDDDERRESSKKEDNDSGISGSLDPVKPPVSSAEAAFDAFKAFFTPKPLKRDPADRMDLEAVRKKIRSETEVLRSLFERASSKMTEKKESADGKVGRKRGVSVQTYLHSNTVVHCGTVKRNVFKVLFWKQNQTLNNFTVLSSPTLRRQQREKNERRVVYKPCGLQSKRKKLV